MVGFTWYSLQDQVDWNIGLSKALGNVFPVGLYDLNRDPRPAAQAYNVTMYVLAALLVVGFFCNLAVRPVADRFHMSDAELERERSAPPRGAPKSPARIA